MSTPKKIFLIVQNIFHNKTVIHLLIIAIVSVVVLGAFWKEFYPNGHDLSYHAASVSGMSERNIFEIFTSKIYGVVSNDLGYGEGLFYPPLSHIGAALIYKLISPFGLGVYVALRIFYFLVLFLAGILMRKLILLITKNEKAAIVSAIFYITFPYVIANVLVRSAMAECMMFIFMPMTLIGLYYLMKDQYKKFLLFFTFGCVGMINSHLVMSLFFAIVCLVGFLPKIKNFLSKKKITYFCLSIFITIILSLPFLLPMLQNKINTDYYVFQPNLMSTTESLNLWTGKLDYVLSIDKTYISNIPLTLGFLGIAILVYVLFNFKKTKTQVSAPFIIFSIITIMLCLLFNVLPSIWDIVPGPLLLIQFPWRLYAFIALSMAILVGVSTPYFEKKSGWLFYIIVIISSLFSIAQINNLPNTDDPAIQEKDLTYASSYVIDYLPTATPATFTNTYVNEHTREPIVIGEDDIEISDLDSKVPDLSFNVSNIEKETHIILPRYYYLGYEIVAIYQNGAKEKINYGMSKEGFIEIVLNSDAQIQVTYPGTNLQKVSYIVAGVTLVIFISSVILKKDKQKISHS